MPAVSVSKVRLLRQHELQPCKHHRKIIAIQLVVGERALCCTLVSLPD